MRSKPRRAGRHPSLPQFQAEARGDARIFCRSAARAQEARPPGDHPPGLLTFLTDLPVSVRLRARPRCARPYGHPPLSLRPPFGGLFFPPRAVIREASPSAAPARPPRRRYHPLCRSVPVPRRGQHRPQQAHAPGSSGRDRTGSRGRPAPDGARGRCSPRPALRAIREEEEAVQLPYC